MKSTHRPRRLAVELLEDRALLSAGNFDRSFGTNGTAVVYANGGTITRLHNVTVDSQGRNVFVGSELGPTGYFNIDITRTLPNGKLDKSFSGDGYQQVDLSEKFDEGHDVAVTADGKVWVVGVANGGTYSRRFTIVRLNDNGTFDNTFQGDGIVQIISGTTTGTGNAIAVQPDGKVVVAGEISQSGNNPHAFFARFNADGTFDDTFDGEGQASFLNLPTVQDIVVQPDGKIVAVGRAQPDASYPVVFRLNSDGSLDTSFHGTGSLTIQAVSSNSLGNKLAIQSDGKILVSAGGALFRLTTDGNVDTTFATNGRAGYDAAQGILVQQDDKIVVISSYYRTVTRLTKDGLLDTSFNGTGKQIISEDGLGAGFIYKGAIYVSSVKYAGKHVDLSRLQGDSGPASAIGRLNGTILAAVGQTNNTFVNKTLTTWSKTVAWTDVMTADVDGNGLDDLVARNPTTGQWQVSLDKGNYVFATSIFGTWSTTAKWANVQAGDVNGDGRADIFGRDTSTGQLSVALSTGAKFNTSVFATWPTNIVFADVRVADLTGDGKADVIGRNLSTGQWNVGVSNGTKFTTSIWGAWTPSATWLDVRVVDVNQDGKADVAGRNKGNGGWYVSLSTGTALGAAAIWTFWSTTATWNDVKLIDMDGDGRADLVGRVGNNWYVGRNTGNNTFSNKLWGQWTPETYVDVVARDFNGDGLPDIAARNSKGEWQVLRNTTTAFAALAKWGVWSSNGTWKDVRGGVI